jgi:hypothetical protein
MKKLILTLGLIVGGMSINAQVAIGKATVDGDGLLDFASGTTNGIILPIVETLPATPANGTILMDRNDLKIKMRENGSWVELSTTGNLTSVTFNPAAEAGEGAIIGSETSSADGVLVLESTNKALILPKVANPQLNVRSPHAGMMCYDTISKSIAVFDGARWHFWQ